MSDDKKPKRADAKPESRENEKTEVNKQTAHAKRLADEREAKRQHQAKLEAERKKSAG